MLFMLSCAKELSVTGSIGSHCMPRYLSSVTEYLHANSYYPDGAEEKLFYGAKYDHEGRVTNAYCNFVGYSANHLYEYEEDMITLKTNSIDGDDSTWVYTISDNKIVSCDLYSSTNTKNHVLSFAYEYDDSRHLTRIHEYSSKGKETSIHITWKGENIIDISCTSFSEKDKYYSNYSYQYAHNKKYKNAFPMIHVMCYYYGGLQGLDEILVSEGYFGTAISKDLPIKEIPSFGAERTYSYTIDKYGYLAKIRQLGKSESHIIREYSFVWR